MQLELNFSPPRCVCDEGMLVTPAPQVQQGRSANFRV